MGRGRGTSLERTGEAWEVGMIHREAHIDGVDVVGLLVVVEQRSGTIRLSCAVQRAQSPAEVFRLALHTPNPPARPGLPAHVVLADPDLRLQLSELLEQVAIPAIVLEATPALDDAIARLLHQAGAPQAPGIDGSTPQWREALEGLSLATERERQGTTFAFEGAGLDEAVAVVFSGPERVPGLVLYASRGDLERHRRALQDRDRPREVIHTLHAMLEPRSELSDAEVERCRRAGLQLSSGLYPRVYAGDGRSPRSATAEEQARLLIALCAVVELCRSGGRRAARLELSPGHSVAVTRV